MMLSTENPEEEDECVFISGELGWGTQGRGLIPSPFGIGRCMQEESTRFGDTTGP